MSTLAAGVADVSYSCHSLIHVFWADCTGFMDSFTFCSRFENGIHTAQWRSG